MQAIDVIEKNQLTCLKLERNKISRTSSRLHMQRSTGVHRCQRADGIELTAAVTEIGVAMEITHPAVVWQAKAIRGDLLHVTGLADSLDHAPAKLFIKTLLLAVLAIKALVGLSAVVLPRPEQGIGPHMLLQRLQRQSHGFSHSSGESLTFGAGADPLQMQPAP